VTTSSIHLGDLLPAVSTSSLEYFTCE